MQGKFGTGRQDKGFGSAVPVVPDGVVTYIETNPTAPVMLEGEGSAGVIIPADVPLVAIPDEPRYSYVYVNDQPVLVEAECGQPGCISRRYFLGK